MSNLVNMVMAAVLNLLSPTADAVEAFHGAPTIEAVVEQQLPAEDAATAIRFESENC